MYHRGRKVLSGWYVDHFRLVVANNLYIVTYAISLHFISFGHVVGFSAKCSCDSGTEMSIPTVSGCAVSDHSEMHDSNIFLSCMFSHKVPYFLICLISINLYLV